MKLVIYTLQLGLMLLVTLTVVSCTEEPTAPPKPPTTQRVVPTASAIATTVSSPSPPRPTIPAVTATSEPGNPTTATALALPSPPIEIPLGAVPTNCAAPPTPQDIAPERFAPAIGGNPVWMISPARFELASDATRYGYMARILLAIKEGYTNAVSLRGYNISDYSAVWFEVLDNKRRRPQQVPTIIPAETTINYAEWNTVFTYLYFPSAGCYAIEAAWTGGSWSIEVAVGRFK